MWWSIALVGTAAALLALGRPVGEAGRSPRRGTTLVPRWVLWWRRAREVGPAIHEVCEVLASELAAGRPTLQALEVASGHWDGLDAVVRAHRVGVPVAEALRQASRAPGAGDLRLLAAAWEVAERSGHGLADAVRRIARGIEASQRSRRVVDSELASARATARLVACLPVAALAMGSGTGADPFGFLLGTPVGWLAAIAGLGLLVAGLAWIEAIARGASG